jgi:hypothetical protein
MDERLKRLIELKDAVRAFFEVTGVGVSGYEAGFEAVRRNDAMAESFVADLRRLLVHIEREIEQPAKRALIAAAEAPAGRAFSAGAAAARPAGPPPRSAPPSPPARQAAAPPPAAPARAAAPARPVAAAAPARPARPEPTRPAPASARSTGTSSPKLGPPMQRPSARAPEPARAAPRPAEPARPAHKPADRGHITKKAALPERPANLKVPNLQTFDDEPEDPTERVQLLPPQPRRR